MTRKERIKKVLEDAGLKADDKVVDSMDKAFGEELDGNFIPKGKFDEVNEQLKNEKDSNKKLTDEIGKLKTFEGTNEELKSKVTELQRQIKADKEQNEKNMLSFRKKSALRMQLAKDKAQDPDLVLGLMNLDDIGIDDNDNIVSGYKEKVADLKKNKSFLFKADEPKPETSQQKYAFLRGHTPGKGDADTDSNVELSETEKVIKNAIEKGMKENDSAKINSDYFFGGGNADKAAK